jgi:transposase-like protein
LNYYNLPFFNNYTPEALYKIRKKLSISDINELRDIKLSRQIIKRSVMTILYNFSMAGIGEHLMEHFEDNWILKERFIKIPGNATYSTVVMKLR